MDLNSFALKAILRAGITIAHKGHSKKISMLTSFHSFGWAHTHWFSSGVIQTFTGLCHNFGSLCSKNLCYFKTLFTVFFGQFFVLSVILFIIKSTSWEELHFSLAIIPDKVLDHNEPKTCSSECLQHSWGKLLEPKSNLIESFVNTKGSPKKEWKRSR